MSEAEGEPEQESDHQVTPLELFFDLVFAFAFTQVTDLLVDDPTWGSVLHGMLVLAALWQAWGVFAWFTSALNADEGGVRLTMLAAMGAMLFVALAVPGSFGDDAVLFGCAYFVVRLLHLALCTIVARDDPNSRGALLRFVPTAVIAISLLLLAGFLDGGARVTLWVVALAVDYLGPVVIGMGRGWRLAAQHFAERFGLIVLIALGESIIAIGIGAGRRLGGGALAAAALGVVLVSTLWWLYFDVAAIFARRRLQEATGIQRARVALHAYHYLHLPMIAGIVLLAFGVETTLHNVGDPLEPLTAAGLCGGTALYFLGHIAFLFRTTRRVFRRRTIGASLLVALIPAAMPIPALSTLALVTAVTVLVVAYEAIHYRTDRLRVRYPELS